VDRERDSSQAPRAPAPHARRGPVGLIRDSNEEKSVKTLRNSKIVYRNRLDKELTSSIKKTTIKNKNKFKND
jgi:hypothetical protein